MGTVYAGDLTANCELRTTNYELRTANCELRTNCYVLRATCYVLRAYCVSRSRPKAGEWYGAVPPSTEHTLLNRSPKTALCQPGTGHRAPNSLRFELLRPHFSPSTGHRSVTLNAPTRPGSLLSYDLLPHSRECRRTISAAPRGMFSRSSIAI